MSTISPALPIEAPQPHSIFVNGTELTYVVQGSGDAIVVVHGSLGDFRSWSEKFAPLGDHYRVISYSRRAHHPNAWPADYTQCLPSVHADDLAALIDALGVGPAHLFGHSYGGLVSLVLASRRPELIRTLILGETPLLSLFQATEEGGRLFAAMAEQWELARPAFANGDAEAGVRIVLDSVIGEGCFAQLPQEERAWIMDNAAELRVEMETPSETFYSTLSCDDLQKVEAPALLLSGEFSPAIFRYATRELARCLPHVEQAMIPGTSHDLWSPPVVLAAVLGFLARQ
jgi:non-heme chloroperoxidase